MFSENNYKNMSLNNNGDIEEIKNATIELIKKNWLPSNRCKYENFKCFNSEYTDKKDFHDLKISRILVYYLYCKEIYGKFINCNKVDDEEKKIIKEITYAEEKGITCVYFSILFYCLFLCLEEEEVSKNLNVVFGFYHLQPSKTGSELLDSIRNIFGNHQQGLHAFVAYKSIVIDPTIYEQQSSVFDFDTDLIIGNLPKGIDLYGYEENIETILNYANEFSRVNGYKDYTEWILIHINNLKRYMNKFYDLIVESYKS